MYVNDLEKTYRDEGFDGVEIGMMKLFLLLYADDIVIFANTEGDLQNGFDILSAYCNRWKLIVNVNKTKVMVFHRGGNINQNTVFNYDGKRIEIVNKFTYLGVVFSPGGSFMETFRTLSDRSLKAIYKLESYLHKFTDI